MPPIQPSWWRLWAAALFLYTWQILRTADAWHLPDFINLPIHETGHLVFAWGGEVLMVLGGTLGQLILPAVFLVSFARRGDQGGAGTMLWWLGQNCFHIATYIADARAEALPLVGGGEHDWAFLLSTWGLLAEDQAIARAVRGVGLIVMLAGVWWVWRAGRRPMTQSG